MKFLAIPLLAMSLVGCTTHISVRTQIEIDAPVDRVYATLTEFENYAVWNPYHVRVRGDATVGAELEVRVKRPDGKVIDIPAVYILRMKENAELTWGGGIKGVFYGEHVFLLKELDNGKTLLIHNEDFEGIFIGFADLPPDVLTRGYQQMNEALKRHLEDASHLSATGRLCCKTPIEIASEQ